MNWYLEQSPSHCQFANKFSAVVKVLGFQKSLNVVPTLQTWLGSSIVVLLGKVDIPFVLFHNLSIYIGSLYVHSTVKNVTFISHCHRN